MTILARSSAETLIDARSRVRLEVNDSDASSERWTDAQLDRSISDSVRFLVREKSNRDPGELLVYLDLNYSGEWFDLGATIGSASIIKVEVVDSAGDPSYVSYVPITTLETAKSDRKQLTTRVYSLAGDATSRKIGVRPYTAMTLRIWYLSEAFEALVGSDEMPLQPTWMRLIQLHSAKALRSVEGEWTGQQESNLQEMMHLWKTHRQAGGPRMIPVRRRD